MAGYIYAFINELSFEGQFAPADVAKGLLYCTRGQCIIKRFLTD